MIIISFKICFILFGTFDFQRKYSGCGCWSTNLKYDKHRSNERDLVKHLKSGIDNLLSSMLDH